MQKIISYHMKIYPLQKPQKSGDERISWLQKFISRKHAKSKNNIIELKLGFSRFFLPPREHKFSWGFQQICLKLNSSLKFWFSCIIKYILGFAKNSFWIHFSDINFINNGNMVNTVNVWYDECYLRPDTSWNWR